MTSATLASIGQLRALEAEAVHVMREVVAELERPVLMFSGGKDSIVLLRLAEKAFAPAALPFTVLHVDTGHNFPEVLEFRDARIREAGHELIVASVQQSIDSGRVQEDDPTASRNRLQTRTLLDALEAARFDAAFGGARRDEERARAKERVFSFRDEFGQWEPHSQRAEPVGPLQRADSSRRAFRVFPMSNFTQLAAVSRGRNGTSDLAALTDGLRAEREQGITIDVAYRRVGQVARLFADAGVVAVVSLVSPLRSDRDVPRQLHDAAGLPFIEVHVDTDIEECARRDPRGLYARARAGEVKGFTGVDAPYESPEKPEIHVDTAAVDVGGAVEQILAALELATDG